MYRVWSTVNETGHFNYRAYENKLLPFLVRDKSIILEKQNISQPIKTSVISERVPCFIISW